MRPLGEYRNYSSRARRVAFALDRLAAPLAPLLRLAGPRGRDLSPAPTSILVVRLDHLGDVLLSTPALAALRAAFPRARLEVLAAPWGAAALRGNPHVDAVLRGAADWYEPRHGDLAGLPRVLAAGRSLRRTPYDWAVDLRGDPRVILFYLLPAARRRIGFSGLGLEGLLTDRLPYPRRRGMLDAALDLLASVGVPPAGRRPVFAVTPEDRAEAEALLGEAGIAAGIHPAVVAPGSNRAQARWGAEGFAAVCAALAERGPVVVVGAPSDADAAAEVVARAGVGRSLAGRTSLGGLAALLERACVLVANDSAPSHVAAAVGCPVVAVFGPSDPELTFPYEDGLRYASVSGPTDHPRPCFDPGCASDHGFGAIDPRAVAAAARRAAEAGPAGRA
jgi:ADP-heptose:LPS heptosyltransferase